MKIGEDLSEEYQLPVYLVVLGGFVMISLGSLLFIFFLAFSADLLSKLFATTSKASSKPEAKKSDPEMKIPDLETRKNK